MCLLSGTYLRYQEFALPRRNPYFCFLYLLPVTQTWRGLSSQKAFVHSLLIPKPDSSTPPRPRYHKPPVSLPLASELDPRPRPSIASAPRIRKKGWRTANKHERRLLHPPGSAENRGKLPFFRAGASSTKKRSPSKLFGVELVTLKKIIPLGVMFFCILFNYTILVDTKGRPGGDGQRRAAVHQRVVKGGSFLHGYRPSFVLYPLSRVIHPTALADKLLAALGPPSLS
ncbi:hypothetical protein BHM03_00040308 [Ensete ventricosum]|nr:hypothetical protein BHM03_00040308 [Ensete ventricosum]